MSTCNFEHLLQFVNNQLDPDRQLEVYDHLDRCGICRDAVCQISRDLNRALFIYCAHCAKQRVPRRHTEIARSGRAQISASVFTHSAMRRSAGRHQ
jgi:predicted anti-sigma-YlaC factor YlaD